MSNDLIELTNTELDAVSGGIKLHDVVAMNFGNITVPINYAQEAVVNMGGGNTTSQSINQTNNTTVGGSGSSGFSFGDFSL